jgi:anhydro-N-acetylmuramic acid kinase
LEALNLQDGCATLEAFTAECIVESLNFLKFPIPKLWVLAGGGWKNNVITKELEQRLRHKLGPGICLKHAEEVGWNSKTMEAQIFAYLAVRSLRKLPLSLPGTTGVPKPLTGGKIVFPEEDIRKASKAVQVYLSQPGTK